VELFDNLKAMFAKKADSKNLLAPLILRERALRASPKDGLLR